MATMATLADALRQFGAACLATRTLSTPQVKAWRGIVACRTAALGGQQLACDACGTAIDNTTRVATGIARSAAHGPRMPGCKGDWPRCCRCPTRIWCLRCRTV